MRILVWNINMAAHKKIELLQQLDYCFLPTRWISQASSVWVGSHEEWLTYSDYARC